MESLFKEHAENIPDKAPIVSQLWQEKKELPKKETNFPRRKSNFIFIITKKAFKSNYKYLWVMILHTVNFWNTPSLPERIQSMGENIRLRVRHLTYSLWLAGDTSTSSPSTLSKPLYWVPRVGKTEGRMANVTKGNIVCSTVIFIVLSTNHPLSWRKLKTCVNQLSLYPWIRSILSSMQIFIP